MPAIESLTLHCSDPVAQQQFYCEVLGMQQLPDNTVGYGHEQAAIRFLFAKGEYHSNPSDLYWKIALSVPDIELACQQLSDKGLQIGVPEQFQDIGYLAHFYDPAGFTIELIEHWFKGNRPNTQVNKTLLGGGASLTLITLRTADRKATLECCIDLGMKLLSVQPVENYGFTLYFFAFTDETPPSKNLHSVDNREWLYQRPYTVLEVQHLHEAANILQPDHDKPGYAGTGISGCTNPIPVNPLNISIEKTG